jgi:hypothetical protein
MRLGGHFSTTALRGAALCGEISYEVWSFEPFGSPGKRVWMPYAGSLW